MKERGMIFNPEMVRALLEGRKTQTRRPVKNVRPDNFLVIHKPTKTKAGLHTHVLDAPKHGLCPFGKPGERLWVRETFSTVPDHDEPAGYSAVLYAADGAKPYGKWTPSIHMPREHSRILLEITAVRVERLQEITLGDICKEVGCGLYDFRPATYGFQVWEELWSSIYGEENWRANPWVWVIEFKRVEANS